MNRLRVVPVHVLLSGAVVVLGMVVIVGWVLNIPSWIQVLPGAVPMQFNTALLFVLCGLSLAFKRKPDQIPRLSPYAGGFVLLVSSLTLIEYGAGVNFGIDELFMDHGITTQTSHPGRMAPNTATAFMLFGVSGVLAISGLPRNVRLFAHTILATMIMSLGAVALSGYVSHIEVLFGWGEFTRMAIHTAIGFVTLGTGMLLFSFRMANENGREWFHLRRAAVLSFAGTTAFLLFWASLRVSRAGDILSFTVMFSGVAITVLAAALWWQVSLLKLTTDKLEVQMAELQATQAENERLESISKEMLTIIWHELRTPMTSFKGYADLLALNMNAQEKAIGDREETKRLLDESNDYLNRMLKGGQRMEMVVMYASAMIDKPSIRVVNAAEAAKHVIYDPRVWITTRRSRDEVSIRYEGDDKLIVEVDEQKLHTCMIELVRNGIKHSRAGEAVTLSVYRLNGNYSITCHNWGEPIPESQAAVLFERFRQIESPMRRMSEGIGLGLPMVKAFVMFHGGTIRFESNQEEGTTFYLKLPIE